MGENDFFAPGSVNEAVELLGQHGARMSVLAGGTDLVPKINYYELKPELIMFIGRAGLDYIREEDGRLVIGTAATTAALMDSDLIAAKAPALAEAARNSAAVAIRSQATIGGNLVNASPAADLATPLLAMDAQVQLSSTKGSRQVPLKDFFTGPGQTVLAADELLTEIHLPAVKGETVFIKLGRRKAMTLSVANTAVRLVMNGGTCEEARIAVGSMAPTPVLCTGAQAMLEGKTLDNALIQACADAAIAETKPIDDQRASAWYRLRAGKAIVCRALTRAAGLEA